MDASQDRSEEHEKNDLEMHPRIDLLMKSEIE